jgi:hypothetical protein
MSKEDVELARAWLAGKSELMDDLADLVEGMSHPLDPAARAFLQTIGSAAKAAPRGKARPTPAGAPAPAQAAAQPTPEPPLAAPVSLDELWRRRRERDRAQRLAELGRRNQEAWAEQGAMIDAARRF